MNVNRTLSSLLLFLFFLSLSGCNSVFYYPRPEILDPPKVDKPLITETETKTPDGLTLKVWIRKPEQKVRAVLLHFHGNAENLSTHYYFVSWLGQHGIELILFDYRGYGESEGEPSQEGLVIDGRTALRFASQRAEAAGLPLFVLGQSLGGAVSIPALAEEKTKVRALIVDSTFPSYRRVARKKVAEFWLLWPFQWPLSFLIGDSWNPEDFVDRIHCPVVVIHGEHDPIVPFENGKKLFDLFPTTEKQFWPVPQSGHLSSFRPGNPIKAKFVNYLQSSIDGLR